MNRKPSLYKRLLEKRITKLEKLMLERDITKMQSAINQIADYLKNNPSENGILQPFIRDALGFDSTFASHALAQGVKQGAFFKNPNTAANRYRINDFNDSESSIELNDSVNDASDDRSSIELVDDNTPQEKITANSNSYSVGAGFTKDQAKKQFKLLTYRKGSVIDFASINRLVDVAYTEWERSFKNDPKKIPFRFSANNKPIVKIAPIYREVIPTGLYDTYNKKSFTVGGVLFEFGNGTITGNRAKKGLEYENTIQGEFANLIITAATSDNPDAELKSNHLYPIYKKGDLDKLIEMYRKDNTINLLNYIFTTGGGNTQRNQRNQLFDKRTFTIKSSDLTDVLFESGKIIADITIKNGDEDVYISVKMDSSQNSAPSCKFIFEENKSIQAAFENDDTYDSIAKASDMLAFNNFCSTIGADPEDVFNKFNDKLHNRLKDGAVKLTSYDPKKLGTFFQKLMGGNFWYVKPSAPAVFVDFKNYNLQFNRHSVYVTAGKRGSINVEGDINGVPITLYLRTSTSSDTYPCRLFPKFSVPKLIDSIV